MSTPPFRATPNGYSRIGYCVLRVLREHPEQLGSGIIALNDLADQTNVEYLTRSDSIRSRFPGEVKVDSNCLYINGDCVKVLRSPTPEAIDRQALWIDLMLKCSGQYTSRAQAERFLRAGAPWVLSSQLMASEVDIDAATVYGVNQQDLSGRETLVSNASYTTNCGVPLLKLLNEVIGLGYVSITTIHPAMSDQPMINAYHHGDLRRTRSVFQSVVSVSTGLVRGIEHLLPELAGRVQAKAMRVPTVNVSTLDIILRTSRDISATEINRVLCEATESNPLRGLPAYIELSHASCGFSHNPRSAIVDGSQARAPGPYLIDLLAWFDNKRGFANCILDVVGHYLRAAVPDQQVPKD